MALGETVGLAVDLVDVEFLRSVQSLQGSEAVDGHAGGASDEGEEEGLVLGVEGLQDLKEGGREGGREGGVRWRLKCGRCG